MFETVIECGESNRVSFSSEKRMDLDGLNYLAGKTVDFVNKSAMNGTVLSTYRWKCTELNGDNSRAERILSWTVILLL